MKSQKTLFIILIVFVLVLAWAYLLYNALGDNSSADYLQGNDQGQESDSASQGSEASSQNGSSQDPKISAPDFKVYDKDGNATYLSDYSGKPVIVNFWASWCGPCKMEMPDFEDKYRAFGSDIQFMMVNMTDGYRETVDTASSFIEEEGYVFPVFYDRDSSATNTYGVYSLPMTFFIDADGYIVAQATGAIDGETLQRGIDMM